MLTWAASAGAATYEYCVNAVSNHQTTCDTLWTSTTAANVTLANLLPGHTYAWQVRAVNPGGVTDSNGGWWTFSTLAAPDGFNKSLPANGAINQLAKPTLTWTSSRGAVSYQYCIDTTNNDQCDNNTWTGTGANTSVTLATALVNGITYYWQVRAVNAVSTSSPQMIGSASA